MARLRVGAFAPFSARAFRSLVDRTDVDARVEGRVGREREELTGVHVHGDEGAAVRRPLAVVVREPHAVRERLLRRPLELVVDREPEAVAGLRHLAELALAGHAPERVDVHAPEAGLSAEVRVVGSLDPGLADPVAGGESPRLSLGQLLGRDLGLVAEDLRCDRSLLVPAQVGLGDLHSGKLGLVLEQEGRPAIAHVGADGHRCQRIVGELLGDLGAHDLRAQAEDAGEAEEHRVPAGVGHVLERRRPHLDERSGHVGDEHVAVPVDDRAALRLEAEAADLVVLRVREVLVARDHLQRPEPEEERAEDDDGEHAEDPQAHRHLGREAVRLLDARVGREEAWAAGRLPGRPRQRGSPRGGCPRGAGGSGRRARRSDRRAAC